MIALEVRLQKAAEDAVANEPHLEEVNEDRDLGGITPEEVDEVAEAAGLAAKLAAQKRFGMALQLSDVKRLMRLIGLEV